jgi:GDP-D-mannose dehydratase
VAVSGQGPDAQVSRRGFWRGRRVLVTGHTGFKGAWLALILGRLGARQDGVGRDIWMKAREARSLRQDVWHIQSTGGLRVLKRMLEDRPHLRL